jgi:hypothetical protein
MKYPLFCRILIKIEFYRQIFEKVSSIKFNQNPSSGSWVAPCGRTDGRTDGHDETNGRFSPKIRIIKWHIEEVIMHIIIIIIIIISIIIITIIIITPF